MNQPTPSQTKADIEQILKPLKSLRGITTEQSAELQREDFDQALTALLAIVQAAEVRARQQAEEN